MQAECLFKAGACGNDHTAAMNAHEQSKRSVQSAKWKCSTTNQIERNKKSYPTDEVAQQRGVSKWHLRVVRWRQYCCNNSRDWEIFHLHPMKSNNFEHMDHVHSTSPLLETENTVAAKSNCWPAPPLTPSLSMCSVHIDTFCLRPAFAKKCARRKFTGLELSKSVNSAVLCVTIKNSQPSHWCLIAVSSTVLMQQDDAR